MDGFALAEVDAGTVQMDLLWLCADQMHFDAALRGVEEGAMLERRKVEIGSELAIDPRQQVQIEFRRHAGGIVIGVMQDRVILDQIDADQKQRARAERLAGMAQK